MWDLIRSSCFDIVSLLGTNGIYEITTKLIWNYIKQ